MAAAAAASSPCSERAAPATPSRFEVVLAGTRAGPIVLAPDAALTIGRGDFAAGGTRISREHLKITHQAAAAADGSVDDESDAPLVLVQNLGANSSMVVGTARVLISRSDAAAYPLRNGDVIHVAGEEDKQITLTIRNKLKRRAGETLPRPCKYGAACYQTNPRHLREFSHPAPDQQAESLPSCARPLLPLAEGDANEREARGPDGRRLVHAAASRATTSDSASAAAMLAGAPAVVAAAAAAAPAAISLGLALQLPVPRIARADLKGETVIGGGAFGDVFRATWLGTPVAVKRLHSSVASEAQRQQFEREAFLCCQLRHPNIVQVLGVCLEAPLAIVMEFLPSTLLDELLDGPVAQPRAHVIAMHIARGLSYLHSQVPPIIHRDLKPQNVLRHAASGVLKLADFGISRTFAGDSSAAMTRIGTPAYMAPEVIRASGGRVRYDVGVDVYALGAVMAHVLTGELPFAQMEPMHIVAAVATGTAKLSIEVPQGRYDDQFVALFRACLDGPAQRPSAQAVLDALDALLPGGAE